MIKNQEPDELLYCRGFVDDLENYNPSVLGGGSKVSLISGGPQENASLSSGQIAFCPFKSSNMLRTLVLHECKSNLTPSTSSVLVLVYKLQQACHSFLTVVQRQLDCGCLSGGNAQVNNICK